MVIIGADGETEAEQITAFWDLYKKYRADNGHIVGFNSHGFDLPFLIRRLWFHGIPVPDTVIDANGYFSATFIDLMRVWGCGRGIEYIGLGTLCQFFGIGAKTEGVNGGDFARRWGAAETRQQAIGYLTNDLDMTWKLAQRMEVAR